MSTIDTPSDSTHRALTDRLSPRIGPLYAITVYAVQFGLFAWLLSLTPHAERPWTFYAYYGILVATIPGGIDWLSGGRLTPTRRLYASVGLALHPLSFFYGVYPSVWWWDVLAHFVSGSLLAAGAYAFLIALREGRASSSWLLGGFTLHLIAYGIVLGGGVSWEVYETMETHLTVYGPVDTVKDVIVDVLAWAVVACSAEEVLGDLPEGMAARVAALPVIGRN